MDYLLEKQLSSSGDRPYTIAHSLPTLKDGTGHRITKILCYKAAMFNLFLSHKSCEPQHLNELTFEMTIFTQMYIYLLFNFL